MFSNIGKKIKTLAKVLCWIGIILSILSAIAFFAVYIYGKTNGYEGSYMVLVQGFLILFLGPIISWISSFILYGFGELIEKVCTIEQNTRNLDLDCQSQFKVNFFRIMNIDKLHSQGLITDEEYQKQREEIIKTL